MAGNPDAKLKLLAIKEIMEQYTDDEHILSAEEIRYILEHQYYIFSERKSIYKDMEVLREYEVDVIKTHGGYHIGKRQFEPAEVRLLLSAVQTAGFISRKKTQQLSDKLGTLVSVYQAKDLKSRCVFSDNRKSKNEKLFYYIDLLDRAIKTKKKVRIEYSRRKLSDKYATRWEHKTYILSPYAMIWAFDRYYLVGNYEKYDNLMNVRIDRITDVEITEEKIRKCSEVSEYKRSFDVADYAKKSFNMFSGTPETVELQCEDGMLEQILDRFGENTSIRRSNEGGFRVVIEAGISEGLVSYLMQFGSSIRVIRPESLRNSVVQRARSILGVYESL